MSLVCCMAARRCICMSMFPQDTLSQAEAPVAHLLWKDIHPTWQDASYGSAGIEVCPDSESPTHHSCKIAYVGIRPKVHRQLLLSRQCIARTQNGDVQWWHSLLQWHQQTIGTSFCCAASATPPVQLRTLWLVSLHASDTSYGKSCTSACCWSGITWQEP